MKRTFTIVVTVVSLTIAAVVLLWKFAPSGTVERLAGESGPAKAILCQYPVRVSGDAMAPTFQNGDRVTLSKCISDRSNLAAGTVVLYERLGSRRLSVIREKIEDANGIRYVVSQEARPSEIDETHPDKILAVYEK